ncbi:MAG: hypothetical protein K9J49_13520 [Candidatus Methylopumilus sp.]|nr:hypothetical protein [Candidatus Methylopumilus sp.]
MAEQNTQLWCCVSAGVVVCERSFIDYARIASAPALVFWLSKIRSSGAVSMLGW